MKIVIAPDSFKESLSAPDVAEAIARGWRRVFPQAEVLLRPLAEAISITAVASSSQPQC
ncbi:glycerate kinase, partial [Pseudomonas aeruginosa]|uniref:glycerate kinase n=1 Tax=Pseudomonas aeruginosa TaxID=287 RepID=UPI000AF87C7D